jgi:hypothetical protein
MWARGGEKRFFSVYVPLPGKALPSFGGGKTASRRGIGLALGASLANHRRMGLAVLQAFSTTQTRHWTGTIFSISNSQQGISNNQQEISIGHRERCCRSYSSRLFGHV